MSGRAWEKEDRGRSVKPGNREEKRQSCSGLVSRGFSRNLWLETVVARDDFPFVGELPRVKLVKMVLQK